MTEMQLTLNLYDALRLLLALQTIVEFFFTILCLFHSHVLWECWDTKYSELSCPVSFILHSLFFSVFCRN